MNYLVGDIGNTLTKFSLLNKKNKILISYNVLTLSLNNKKYLKKFTNKIIRYKPNKKILISSVVPTIFKKIKINFKRNKYNCIEIKSLNINKLIKFKVDNYKKVGSDRIANAIGSYYNYKKNCLVIDFGTATTFDIIKKPGIYLGGVIAPGINLSINNLNKHTALLPRIYLKSKSKPYGKNTNDAINSGFIWGYQGLINNILKKIKTSTKTNYKIILTGGHAKLFKNYINNKTVIDNNVTIKGMIKVYKELLS